MGNDEQGVGLSPPEKEEEQTLSQKMQGGEEQQPTYQQGDDSHGAVSSYLMATGGQAGGEEVVCREESLSIQEPGTSQLVNGQQQQPAYQLSAQTNVSSYRTQEMGLDGSQRRVGQEVRPPIQETGPSAERMPDEHEDLPPGHPQFNGADVNGVSSTGEREQAVEHNCGRQELQLWKQELDRQADVQLHTLYFHGK